MNENWKLHTEYSEAGDIWVGWIIFSDNEGDDSGAFYGYTEEMLIAKLEENAAEWEAWDAAAADYDDGMPEG